MRPAIRQEKVNLSQYENSSSFPLPQKTTSLLGFLEVPPILNWSTSEESFEIALRFFQKRIGLSKKSNCGKKDLIIQKKAFSSPEGYRLKISSDSIYIETEREVGAFRALTTLWQLKNGVKSQERIPCMEIEDGPALARRGFMLDVSRCKVPTMKCLFELIDLLADLRYNELQLYIEHTFAFRDHETVWKDSSPFSGEQIRAIDDYCKERFIELVPNLNSFGHFERWLKHDRYKSLAECPNGFLREEPFMERDHGTTLKPNRQSLDFIDSLYKEYLPNFSSTKFNVGMDEPWELGQGWSKERVKREGKGQVYLKHLEGIRKLVEKHGRQMHFWADVLLEEPANASLLSPSASPIIWGYEADHPFSEQAEVIASCGNSFCLAPGTGTWRTFTGRWENTKANLESALKNALAHKADGILLTSWGDCGNHQPWATIFPPLAYCAQLAWNGSQIDDSSLCVTLNRMVFHSNRKSKGPAQKILSAGSLDRTINSYLPNRSLTWNLIFETQRKELTRHVSSKHSEESLEEGLKLLRSLRSESPETGETPESILAHDEIDMGLDLSIIALERALSMLRGRIVSSEGNLKLILQRYESLWPQRARLGGLKESLVLLEEGLSLAD